jgi:predicted PurR-regulated permease PerM
MATMELRIPFATLLKIALAVLLVLCVVKLWPIVIIVVIAVLIAVMLDPVVRWLERHRVRRGLGIAAVAIVIFGLLLFFVAVIVPIMSRQVVELSRDLPQVTERLAREFPPAQAVLGSVRGMRIPEGPQLRAWLTRGLAAGMYAVEGLTAVIFVLVVAIYLLIEGRRAFQWLITFAEPRNRKKLERTAHEIGGVILAYMRGQAITCFLCGGWAYLVLTLCRVPAALALAVIAFVADLVPVVGTIVMTVPAVLLALLVGPMQALLVAGGYLLYHLVESYFIVPRIYGSQMRLSTLTVLLAVAAGGTLQGALGAVLILPFVAAYPIVERIWLREQLPDDAVARHEAMSSSS